MSIKDGDVSELDEFSKNHATFLHCCTSSTSSISSQAEKHVCNGKCRLRWPKFMVIGHRGSGMNLLQSPHPRMKFLKENSIRSFNAAFHFSLQFIEFDVQVTKDGCPIIFHDNFIRTRLEEIIVEKRVTELSEAEFLSYGPQKNGNVEKPLWRETKDGRVLQWKVEEDDSLCTLRDAFRTVNRCLGFNIELKYDDDVVYGHEELARGVRAILKVVEEHSNNRPIIFSSFHPDAAQLIRKLQNTFPVLFITNGGSEPKADTRRNSLDEAVHVCNQFELQGIVSEVKALLRNPDAAVKIQQSNLSLLSYGQLNNVARVVREQWRMGVEGVIVDMVDKIAEAVSGFDEGEKEEKREKSMSPEVESGFSFLLPDELLFLKELMPELVLS